MDVTGKGTKRFHFHLKEKHIKEQTNYHNKYVLQYSVK